MKGEIAQAQKHKEKNIRNRIFRFACHSYSDSCGDGVYNGWVTMDLEKFLVSSLIFVFAVFLFPTLNNEIAKATITSNIAPVIRAFPMIFLVVTAVFPIYFGLKGKES